MPLDQITVCICTFRRPRQLVELLDRLDDQVVTDAFDFDIVVVENDPSRESEHVVRDRPAGRRPVRYACEPERNIALARNRAVGMASGNCVALIDDDETPVRDWLNRLHATLTASATDGVLGPVVPHYEPGAPAWLRSSRVMERARHRTGERISARDSRTGNALLRRRIFADSGIWFDPALGRSGGEDSDFFARCMAAGHAFVWCDEAVVTEVVPAERWTPAFHLRRMWRSGTVRGEWIRSGQQSWVLAVRGAALIIPGTVLLPVSLLLPAAWRMRLALKMAYFGGVVTAALGWSSGRDRE